MIILLNSAAILILSTVTLEVFSKRYGQHRTRSSQYSILYICPLAFIYFVTQALINIAYNPVIVVENRLYYNTNTTQNKMLALEAYTEMQKQYINEEKQKYENTKAFRHDVHNHMVTLAGLVQSNETEKIKEYLKRFEREAKNLAFEVFTGNAVIDVLFKEKLGFAKEQGIKVVCDAAIPKGFKVDDFDLCIIFFNALDNAIKACEYANEKLIDVAAKKNFE